MVIGPRIEAEYEIFRSLYKVFQEKYYEFHQKIRALHQPYPWPMPWILIGQPERKIPIRKPIIPPWQTLQRREFVNGPWLRLAVEDIWQFFAIPSDTT